MPPRRWRLTAASTAAPKLGGSARSERRSEMIAGLRADRGPDDPVPRPPHRADLLRRCTSACGDWGAARAQGFLAVANYEIAAHATRSSTRRSTTRSTTRPLVVPLRWRSGCSSRSSSTRRSAARRSSGRRSTSRPSPARRRSRCCASSSSARGACSTASARRSASTRSSSRSGSARTTTGSATSATALNSIIAAQRLDDVRARSCCSTSLPPDDQQGDLRGGRDRWRQRVADVPAHHVPAAPARPLLRGHGLGHRGAPDVRPGDHRRRHRRRPEQRPDDDRAVPLPVGDHATSTSGSRRRSGSSCSSSSSRSRSSSAACSAQAPIVVTAR